MPETPWHPPERSAIWEDRGRHAEESGRPENRADILRILDFVQENDPGFFIRLEAIQKFLQPHRFRGGHLRGHPLMMAGRQSVELGRRRPFDLKPLFAGAPDDLFNFRPLRPMGHP